MYLLCFVDEINCSFSGSTIKEGAEVLHVSNDVEKLKDSIIDRNITKWRKNDMGQEYSMCVYGDEFEKGQYYLIVEVEEI